MLYKIIVLSLFLCSSAWATVPVERYPSGTPVQVCQPSDTNSNCGGGNGTVNSGTVNQVGYYASSTTAISGSSAIYIGGSTSGSNVGIGTSANQAGLAIMNGNVGIGTWVPSALFQVGGTGNVGVGSNIPGDTLDVQGTIRFNGNLAGGITGNIGIGTTQTATGATCDSSCNTAGKRCFGGIPNTGGFDPCSTSIIGDCICLPAS